MINGKLLCLCAGFKFGDTIKLVETDETAGAEKYQVWLNDSDGQGDYLTESTNDYEQAYRSFTDRILIENGVLLGGGLE